MRREKCGRQCDHGDAGKRKQDCQRVADRKSTRLNSSHLVISYAVFCLKKKNIKNLLLATPILIPVLAYNRFLDVDYEFPVQDPPLSYSNMLHPSAPPCTAACEVIGVCE